MKLVRLYRNPDAQCLRCHCFGIHQKEDEIYWTCDTCGATGGIFNNPITFVIRIQNSDVIWTRNRKHL